MRRPALAFARRASRPGHSIAGLGLAYDIRSGTLSSNPSAQDWASLIGENEVGQGFERRSRRTASSRWPQVMFNRRLTVITANRIWCSRWAKGQHELGPRLGLALCL